MDLEEFRNKPAWEHYEASLLNRGFVPAWDLAVGELARITCCRCGGVCAYVVMTDGSSMLGFFVCQPSRGVEQVSLVEQTRGAMNMSRASGSPARPAAAT